MALERKDRVKDQSSTTGTGTLTIDAVAPTGYRTIASAYTTGATLKYTIVNAAMTEWEVGQGVWTAAGSTLTRVTVYASTNAGALVNFSVGTKIVFTGPVANDQPPDGNLTLGTKFISYGGTDAGLSFDAGNNATLSANLDVAGTIDVSVYSIRVNGLMEIATNGAADFPINYAGYNEGTTQFRNFKVYDGKNALAFSVDGATKDAAVLGALDVTGVYKAGGTSGVASFGPSVVTSITVKNGIITAIS